MEIDLGALRTQYKRGLSVTLVLALFLLGAVVTPVEHDRPQLLSPQRWTLAHLARQATVETARLVADAQALHATLTAPAPDPIQAMTLAQRIYVTQRAGTPATAVARQAVIEAAAAAARASAGGLSRAAALETVNAAFERIRILVGDPDAATPADS